MWKLKQIFDGEYGCEERQPGEKEKCLVILANEEGEEKIKDVFTEKGVEDKLLRELEKSKDKLTVEQIIEKVKTEMNSDAENFEREHKK